MKRFLVYTGPKILSETYLDRKGSESYFKVNETTWIGFEISNYNENTSYQLKVGDIDISDKQHIYRTNITWPNSNILDGARGITPIRLIDKNSGASLAINYAYVEPSKLTKTAYKHMFNDLRRISVELLLDLVSKSRVTIASGQALRQNTNSQGLTARVELAQIQHLWRDLSLILTDIFEEPYCEYQHKNVVRKIHPGEQLNEIVMRHLVERGRRPQDSLRSGTLFNLQTSVLNRNTRENRVLVAFVNLLCNRVKHNLTRAKDEQNMRNSRLSSEFAFIYHESDVQKLNKLEEIILKAETLLVDMRRVIRYSAVPITMLTRQDIFKSFESPIFRSHPRYFQAARIMRRFMISTAIILEHGDTDSAKTINTIYEQWAFFQICAALHDAGLSCISHNSIFEPIARDRFSVDLDRNAAIYFEASDRRRIRLRYEPTILPFHAAQSIDTLYCPNSIEHWKPDIVLEILEPNDDERDYRLVYAVVVDAKYTSKNRIWDHLKDIGKYGKIKCVDTTVQIVRQVWVIAPVDTSINPRDETLTWSPNGDVSANPSDVIDGVIGANPADRYKTRALLITYILGILNHSKAYSGIVRRS